MLKKNKFRSAATFFMVSLLCTSAFSATAYAEEVFTLTDPNYNIKVETANADYIALNAYFTLPDWQSSIPYPELMYTYYGLDLYELNSEGAAETVTELDENVKVTIPYDKSDAYVINTTDSRNPVQMDAEYIDGAYVFDTNLVGEFILSKKPLESTDVIYSEKTVVHDESGVTVTGMLPDDATMFVSLSLIDDDFFVEDVPQNHKMSNDFAEPSIIGLYSGSRSHIAPIIDETGKIDSSYYECDMAIPVYTITFVKDYKIIDVNSELTITLPVDYYDFLMDKGVDEAVLVSHIDGAASDVTTYQTVKTTTADVPSVTFTTDKTGTFVVSNQKELNSLLDWYEQTDIPTEEPTENPKENPTEAPTEIPTGKSTEAPTAASTNPTQQGTLANASTNGTANNSAVNTGAKVPVAIALIMLFSACGIVATRKRENKAR